MFVINPAKLKKQTIALLVLLVSGSVGVQINWVQQHVTPLVDHHPHWSFLSAALIGALTLIHNPVAQNVVKQVFTESTVPNPGGGTTQTTLESTTKTTP